MSGRSIGALEGVSAVLTGGGVLTLALFPLAIPLIALTVVALLPFLVLGVALAILAAPPLLVARWLRKRARGAALRERSGRTEAPARSPAVRETLPAASR